MKDVKLKPVLFTSKTYADGTHPIFIRITTNRKVSYEGIGYNVKKEAWNPFDLKVFESKPKISQVKAQNLTPDKAKEIQDLFSNAIVLPNAKTINSEIHNRMAEISLALSKMKANEESMDIKSIKTKITSKSYTVGSKSFIAFGEKMSKNYLNGGNISTHKRYNTIINRLKLYRKQKELAFEDITYDFLTNYEIYLKSKNLQTNSIHNHLKTLRAIYYQAIKEQIISQEKNPFFSFKLKLDKFNIKKEKLTVDEIKGIRNLKLIQGDVIWHTRNYFLFSYNLAGIRIGDLMQLKWKYVKDGRIEYTMDKSNKFKSFHLSDEATKILGYYRTDVTKPGDYIFPLLDNNLDATNAKLLHNQISSKTAMVNKNLKLLAIKAEIKKLVTTHVSRHSFADMARKKGIDLHSVKNLLGHSKLTTTDSYLKSLDYESQDEALKIILE